MIKIFYFSLLFLFCSKSTWGQFDVNKGDTMYYELNKQNYKIESAFRNDFKIDINKNNEGKRHEIICESLKFTAVTCLCVGLLIPFYNKEPTKKDKITTWSALSSGVLISVTDILLYFHWKDDIKYYRANHKKH